MTTMFFHILEKFIVTNLLLFSVYMLSHKGRYFLLNLTYSNDS